MLGILLLLIVVAVTAAAYKGVGARALFVAATGLIFLGFTAAIALCGAVAAGIVSPGLQPVGAILFATAFVLLTGPSWRQALANHSPTNAS